MSHQLLIWPGPLPTVRGKGSGRDGGRNREAQADYHGLQHAAIRGHGAP
jgi:hypothetical protein